MNLIIDAELTEPPSEVPVFRDITLYSKIFLEMMVLLKCQSDMKDLYWYWLKNRGAFDFVEDIIEEGMEPGIILGSENATIKIKYLRVENLNYVIDRLKNIS